MTDAANKLTARQRRFVEEYLVDLNATKAAERAGYSERGANVAGARLLANVSVQDAISEAQQARARRTDITADRVLRELALIAFADLGEVFESDAAGATLRMRSLSEMPEETRRAIESLREQPTDKGVVRSVKLHSKVAALKMLADHLGMDPPKRHEHSGPGGRPIETANSHGKLSDEAADAIMRKALLGYRDREGDPEP